MKNSFSEYITPTAQEFKTLWEKSVFVLDANVLLDFYRYSEETRKQLFVLLKRIPDDRLWIPHQAGLEFFENRVEVILSQKNAFEKTKNWLNDLAKHAKSTCDSALNSRPHPALNKTVLIKNIESTIEEMATEIDKQLKTHPDLMDNDPILKEIMALFDGKIGKPYAKEREQQIFKEGQARYEAKIPPGHEDATGQNKKTGTRRFGDLVLWYQIIDKAAVARTSVILVTSDEKEDWWRIHSGRKFGPRPMLRKEMKDRAGADFYLYTLDSFMSHTKKYLNANVEKAAIDEAKSVREYRPDSLATLAKLGSDQFAFSRVASEELARITEYSRLMQPLITQELEKYREWCKYIQPLAAQELEKMKEAGNFLRSISALELEKMKQDTRYLGPSNKASDLCREQVKEEPPQPSPQ